TPTQHPGEDAAPLARHQFKRAGRISKIDQLQAEIDQFRQSHSSLREENESLKLSNVHLQNRAQSAEGRLEDLQISHEELVSQLETMSTKTAELHSVLEREEANTSRAVAALESCQSDSEALGEKHSQLSRRLEEALAVAKNATQENRLKTEEIRVLKDEVDQLKRKNSELRIQSTVELESAQEQLRLRKEKQYQLLGKLQSHEEASRLAEDQTRDLEQNVRDLVEKSSDLQTALQLETSARISQENSNRTMAIDFQVASTENKELRSKLHVMEQDRLKVEAEARSNGDQLREMAEKVFQLLERLKLAELGKKKSTEALEKKEKELFALKKQQLRVTEDNAAQRRMREKVDAEKRVVDDQLRGLKKVNSQLGHKLKDEAKSRIREEELCKDAQEKVRTLDGRLAFLLNRLQTDEEARSVQQEETKKMESQLLDLTQRCEKLQTKLTQSEQNGREVTEKLQQSDKQLKQAEIKYESMAESRRLQEEASTKQPSQSAKTRPEKVLAGGQLRFFVDTRPGHLSVTGKCPKDKVWIDEKGVNGECPRLEMSLLRTDLAPLILHWPHNRNYSVFLRKVLGTGSSTATQEPLVKKIAELYGAILFGEEKLQHANDAVKAKDEEVACVERELNSIQTSVLKEEESKRKILLRYIRAVKASVSLGEPGKGCAAHCNSSTYPTTNWSAGSEADRHEVGGVGSGRVILPDSNLGDEEIHAITAMLRDNITIEELQLRRNNISDDGARAIAAVLAGRSGLKSIDLRDNQVSVTGVKAIADALERSERVHKVMVHPGGCLEGRGCVDRVTTEDCSGPSSSSTYESSLIITVDMRDQKTGGQKTSDDSRAPSSMTKQPQQRRPRSKPTRKAAKRGVNQSKTA
ncbi:hypothetical protein THAOC_09291, partial [Thalassiosira oceanica]